MLNRYTIQQISILSGKISITQSKHYTPSTKYAPDHKQQQQQQQRSPTS